MRSKRLGRWVLAGLGICCVLLVLLWLMGSGNAPQGQRPVAVTKAQALPRLSATSRPVAVAMPDQSLMDLPGVDKVNDYAATTQGLTSKGFPLMSGPRREVVEATASLTIEETVMDLGDLYTLGLSNIYRDGEYGVDNIRRWQGMTRHVKLLRVIEEGRRDPERISTLLTAEIARSLDSLEQVEDDAIFEMGAAALGKPGAVLTKNDEFYRREHRYEYAVFERSRRYESAYAAFYALANMRTLRCPSLLAKWIEVRRPRTMNARDMHVWLIHQYFQQGGAEYQPEASKHKALAVDPGLSSGTTRRTRWNGSWDVGNPLLKARRVNVSGIPTISVLRIPRSLKLDGKTKDAIIANFLAHARRLNKQ